MTRRRDSRHKGFMLLMAVVLVGAIGLTLGLLCRHFAGLTLSVKSMALDTQASRLVADGQAWAQAHPTRCSALAPGDVVDLPVADSIPASLAATLRIVRGETAVGTGGTPPQVVITAIVRQGQYASTSRRILSLSPGALPTAQ